MEANNIPTVSAFIILPHHSHPEVEVHCSFAINSSHLPPSHPLSSPGKPVQCRLPPPLDKWAAGEGSYALHGEEETIMHGENGVVDEEVGRGEQIAAACTDESGGWSLACEIQREEWL